MALADAAVTRDTRDEDLLGALRAEEERSTAFYRTDIAEDQIEATRRYYGKPFGDEVEGRSAVVSRETYETINWLLPDMRRTYASGKTICELDAQNAIEDEYAEDGAEYLNHIFFVDNPGASLIKAFAFDGLLHKVGFIAAYWRPPEDEIGAVEEMTGLNQLQAREVIEDPSVELVEEPELAELPPDETHPDGVFIGLRFRRIPEGRFEIVVRAVEDMRVSGGVGATTLQILDSARNVGCDIPIMVSDLIKLFPAHADAIRENWQAARYDRWDDERRHERRNDEELEYQDDEGIDELSREVILKEDYIRYDYDEDGYAERRAVYRMADVILSNEEVDEQPYSCWTPHPVTHKFFGLSEHDVIKDVERVKTVTTRSGLDALYQAVLPRTYVDATIVNLADLLTPRAGGVIRVDGPIQHASREVVIPDVSPSAITMSEYYDKVGERRSGVMRRAQAYDPDKLHETYKGQQLIDNAESVQKEERIFELKLGLEHHFGKLYRLVCRNVTQARQVRMKGREVVINARHWRKDMKITVNPGPSANSRAEKLGHLQLIDGAQDKVIAALGPENPIVTPRHKWNLYEEACRTIGYDDAGQFFSEPPEGWAPEPPPNPEAEKAKLQAETEKMKVEAKAQADAAALAAKTQIEQQKTAADAESDQAKIDAQARADREKIESEIELKREQIAAEIDLKERQLEAELDLKWQIAMAELEMKERVAEKQISAGVASSGGSANGSGGSSEVGVGGEPG